MGYTLEYSWALVATLWLTVRVYLRTRFRILQACNPPDIFFLISCVYRLLAFVSSLIIMI